VVWMAWHAGGQGFDPCSISYRARIIRAGGSESFLQTSHEPDLTAPDRVEGIANPITWVVWWWTGRKGCGLDSSQPLDLDAADQRV